MADRGRDLKISIISDVSKFDLDDPVKDLEDLADAATDSTDELKRLAAQGKDAQKELDRLNAEVAKNKFDEYGKDAKDTARDVDRAFDDIAKSAKTSMRKVDSEIEKAGDEGFGEFKDEAKSSGREAAASFSGEFSDVAGTIQEIAANAFGGFGPLGTAAGIAAGVGIGLITKAFGDSKAKAEEAKEAIAGWTEAYIEGTGKITEARITANLEELFGDPDRFKEVSEAAKDASISQELYARALSGDVEAAKQVTAQIQAHTDSLDKNVAHTQDAEAAQTVMRNALDKVSTELGITTTEIEAGNTAWQGLDRATRAGITANVEVNVPTARELANERAAIEKGVAKPVDVPVKVTGARTAAQNAWLETEKYFRDHPVVIPTVAGPTNTRGIKRAET